MTSTTTTALNTRCTNAHSTCYYARSCTKMQVLNWRAVEKSVGVSCSFFGERDYEAARSVRRARSLRRRRLSRSEVPPHIPNCSLLFSAYSRHCARTSHPEHTARAAFEDPPRSGKKISGSTSVQRAFVCQSSGCRSFVVIRCIPGPFVRHHRCGPGTPPPMVRAPESQLCNSKLVIRSHAIPLTCVFASERPTRKRGREDLRRAMMYQRAWCDGGARRPDPPAMHPELAREG
jgi:hypothetical protein